HLPHLRRQASRGPGAGPPHRRGSRRAGRNDPDLHQRTGGTRGGRAVTKTMEAHQTESPLARFSDAELEQLAKEFDAIHDEVYDDLGEDDARYIRGVIEFHRRLVVLSRIVLMASRYKPAWVLGTAGLSVAKILENMEIGHNVMHGQWDWMRDSTIHSSTWEWDNVCPKEEWKHSHNFMHHKWTNVVGMDRDVGYGILRMSEEQPWHPGYLFQPITNALLASFFQWGVALHDLETDRLRRGERKWSDVKDKWRRVRKKMGKQGLK